MNFEYNGYLSIIQDNLKINVDQTKMSNDDFCSLITHGHSDHFIKKYNNIFTTKETMSFINNVNGYDESFLSLKYNKEIDINDNLTLNTLNAGHILGSAMFYFENKHNTILYTGDFKTKNSLLLKGAEPVQADILIIESTFGLPKFFFPNRDIVYNDFAECLSNDLLQNKKIIIGAYALGKSQEVIRFLNDYLKETPLVTKKIYDYCKIYEKYNLQLGKYELLNNNFQNYDIVIVPPNLINKSLITDLEKQFNQKISTYILTGWNFYKSSKCVPISDHADFNDLLYFIEQVKPKKVFTMHGFNKEFAKIINNKLGIFAKPLNDSF